MTTFRSILFTILLPVYTIIVSIVLAPTLLRESWARRATKVWAAGVLKMLNFICGMQYDVEGLEHVKTGGALIASKHQSMWETIAFVHILPKPVFVLKQELMAIPIFGWWCKAAGYIQVDRNAGASALRNMVRAAGQAADEGKQVIIFPEGTRMPPGKAGKYHPGVAALYQSLNVPCIPVAHNAGLYWQRPGLTRAPGTICLQFLPALPDDLSRRGFMQRLETTIETSSTALLDICETSDQQMA